MTVSYIFLWGLVEALPPPSPTLNIHSKNFVISTIGRNPKILTGHQYYTYKEFILVTNNFILKARIQ
jgi:hypothetical protein